MGTGEAAPEREGCGEGGRTKVPGTFPGGGGRSREPDGEQGRQRARRGARRGSGGWRGRAPGTAPVRVGAGPGKGLVHSPREDKGEGEAARGMLAGQPGHGGGKSQWPGCGRGSGRRPRWGGKGRKGRRRDGAGARQRAAARSGCRRRRGAEPGARRAGPAPGQPYLTAVQRRLAEPAVQVAGLAAGLPEGQVVLVVRRHPGGAQHGSQVQAQRQEDAHQPHQLQRGQHRDAHLLHAAAGRSHGARGEERGGGGGGGGGGGRAAAGPEGNRSESPAPRGRREKQRDQR